MTFSTVEQTYEDMGVIADITVNPSLGGEIIPSVSIDRIIAQRNGGIALFMEGMAQIHAAAKQLAEAANKDYLCGFSDVVKLALDWLGKPEKYGDAVAKLIDRKVWDRLLSDTGMYTLMSSKQRDEWDRQLNSKDCPEVTFDTVLATFKQLNADKAATFEQGVIDVFRSLSWDYKSNSPCRLGKKIIVERFLNTWRNGHSSFTWEGQQLLDDLARPFYLLDGKNVPDFRAGEGQKYADFFRTGNKISELCDLEYFTVKGFAKGTGHIVFKRPDLVNEINDIVARQFPGMLPSRL